MANQRSHPSQSSEDPARYSRPSLASGIAIRCSALSANPDVNTSKPLARVPLVAYHHATSCALLQRKDDSHSMMMLTEPREVGWGAEART